MSGEHWFGTPPEAWEVRPLGFFFRERKEIVSDRDFPPLSVTMSGIVPQLDTAAKTDNNDSRKLVRTGDFVINSRSDRKGSSGLSDRDGSVSVISTVLVLRAIEGRFAHHLLRSSLFQEEFYRWGSGIVADLWSTRYAAMKRIPLAVPPAREQRAIADFLDRETAQIDAMVDAQERLVALLEERRTAAIDETVARGLREPELVPSSVPWLGEVPKHWSVTAIKHAYESLAGYAFPSGGFSQDGDDVPLLRGINIAPGRIAWEAETYYWDKGSMEEVERYLLREGDIVLGLDRPIISSGVRVAQVTKTDLPALLLQRVARFRPSDGGEPRLLFYWLSSSSFVDYLTPSFTGVSVPHISEGQVRNFVAALPPHDEQREIVEHLDRATAQANAMIAKAQQSIALMKERRAALISAAVTGRIDVRTGIEQVERDLEEARA